MTSTGPNSPKAMFFPKKSGSFAFKLDDTLTSCRKIRNLNVLFRRKTPGKKINGPTYAGYATGDFLGGSNNTQFIKFEKIYIIYKFIYQYI